MADEYISRAKIAAEVTSLSTHPLNEWDSFGVLLLIDRQPAADVAPVVHAHWERVEVREYKAAKLWIASMFCPSCERYHNEVYHYGDPRHNVNYCPFCGARMDERSKDNG